MPPGGQRGAELTDDLFLELDRLAVHPLPAGPVSVTVARGERLVILGAPGTGKSALLLAMAGFHPLAAGDIRLDGHSLRAERPERRGLALMPARGTLFPHQSLRDNLAFALRGRGLPPAVIRQQAQALLAARGLAAVADRRPGRLTPAQRRQGEFARALAAAPLAVLIDTPPGEAPDPALLAEMTPTVVLATDRPEAALGIATRIVLLDAHGVAQVGTPQDLYERPAGVYAARFMGPCNLVASTRGLLAIRPHRLRLDAAGPLRGTVTSVAYHGSATRIAVATPDGAMTADIAEPHGVRAGQAVGLSWRESDAWLLPDGLADGGPG
jgi:ABC-type Fe3+/spermidine/putrescine transport system ATPase subunit